jgi:hypothetical protein
MIKIKRPLAKNHKDGEAEVVSFARVVLLTASPKGRFVQI